MSASFELGTPGFFTAGTVGRPGQRTFYLQAGEGSRVVTLKVEKEQVAALAEHLGGLLDRLAREHPEGAAAVGDLALREPVTAAWAVGSIGVAYEEGPDRVVLMLEELVEAEPEPETEEAAGESHEPGNGPPAATARLALTRPQARAFVERARELVRAGRPPCPVCGRPIDPGGHICARSNGKLRL